VSVVAIASRVRSRSRTISRHSPDAGVIGAPFLTALETQEHVGPVWMGVGVPAQHVHQRPRRRRRRDAGGERGACLADPLGGFRRAGESRADQLTRALRLGQHGVREADVQCPLQA
jgi:hypothetical protein